VGVTEFRAQLFRDYRAGFNDALKAAGIAALASAVVLSLILSRGVTSQVQAMSTAAERIAAGQYQERVRIQGMDELSQLASRFNDMARKLDEVESMRRNLIADVSHELRTPLTAIQGSMEGLIDGVLPETSETYEQIHDEAKRLNRLVDDLQELSRVEAHAFELQLQPVDVPSLVEGTIKRLGSAAAARGVRLEASVSAHLPKPLGDEGRLMQVLSNLTNNALQYTPRGGAVTLSAAVVGGELHVSVRDTGVGIAPDQLPRIFDRFYRIDKSRSRQEGGGSGVGLTIARALVEAHGGRVWAESGGAGKGSTFTFALPR
jgi:histidine kinase